VVGINTLECLDKLITIIKIVFITIGR